MAKTNNRKSVGGQLGGLDFEANDANLRPAFDRLDKIKLEAELENNRQDNKSRSHIAYGFTFAFLSLLTLVVIGVPIYNATIGQSVPLDLSNIITALGAQIGSPLGFVLGYYFKDQKTK